MSILVKRRRGRPRLDESKVISDFDSNLIDEMKKYPILYDRGHKHYKDKAMVNSYWKRVGSGLNVSENVVRNRIFQLRNRYNIEKRRMETNPSVPTSWPLYESLGFLFDFTKRGRRFVMQTKTANGHTAATPSDEEEDEEDIEEEQNDCTMNDRRVQYQTQNHSTRDISEHQTPSPHNSKEVDIDELYHKKFKAFGEFLASSLIEMSEMQALHLVKKFTADLVEYSKLGDINKLSALNTQNNIRNDTYLLD